MDKDEFLKGLLRADLARLITVWSDHKDEGRDIYSDLAKTLDRLPHWALLQIQAAIHVAALSEPETR